MSDLEPRRRQSRTEQKAETRTRLMDAAEALFISRGIGDTSLEEICTAAGYSRGAFYSNFADRNALVFELLERHQERTMAETQALAVDATPEEFIRRLAEREWSHTNEQAALFMEYVLFTTRHPESKARLRALNDRIVTEISEIVDEQFRQLGVTPPIESRTAAKIVLGLDEGFALLRLIDPDGYPAGLWGDTMAFLNEAAYALAVQNRSAG